MNLTRAISSRGVPPDHGVIIPFPPLQQWLCTKQEGDGVRLLYWNAV